MALLEKVVGVPSEPTLSIRIARALAEAVERAGIDRVQFLQLHSFSDLRGGDEIRVPSSSFHRMCESALQLTGDPAFGLHWSERMQPALFNPVAHVVLHAGTLGAALDALARYHRLFSDCQCFAIDEVDGSVVVRYLAPVAESEVVQRFVSELVLGGFYKLLKMFSVQARPHSVSFSYPAPSYRDEYKRVFACTERFGHSYTGIAFDRSFLSALSPHKDEDVYVALRAIAEQRTMRLTRRASYARRVRERLVTNGPTQRPTMSAVARRLGLSVRSLRRRLEVEGTSYSVIVNEALGILAKQLIHRGSGTIQEIAVEMGFADTSSFHRAFKRWTGMTPREYRAAQTPVVF